MHPLNPVFALLIFLIAVFTAYILKLKYDIIYTTARYESIDGLRGFLAIGVFIHHSSIWYQYLQTGNWQAPKSNLYNQLGQTSVSLFFMITSFLFVTKLLNDRKSFHWKQFYISRIFRLVPLYYVSLLFIILYVMIISNWELKVELSQYIGHLFNWGIFTIIKASDINGSALTQLINSKVVWSLPFEWLFYFSLPLLSFIIAKNKSSKLFLAFSIIFISVYHLTHKISLHNLLPFAGGAVAPFVLKYTSWNKNINSYTFTGVIAVCFISISFFNEANFYCQIILTVAFTIIALGNSFFGLLRITALKLLGEISYSTYLLHGIIIFSVIYFGFGMENAKRMNAAQYCTLIFLLTPAVVCVSFIGFNFIEKPFINMGKIVAVSSTSPSDSKKTKVSLPYIR